MKLTRAYTLSYQQIRHIFSQTGVWKKKISKTALVDIEKHWKAAVLSPTSTNVEKLGKDGPAEKKYILSMFPYPSGELHMGHMRVYTVSDVLARYHRLNGHQVLHPIGWDAFGLPAENAAIDRKVPPRKWTESNIARMRRQLHDLRISFDWDREITTCNADYYKWTQLLFLRMYAKGLAYSMTASVNWDPVDQTVLADEQIDENGCSWRSGAKATKKYLTQWYLRATNYTQSLLDGLDSLDPDSCRGFANAQRAWLQEPTGVRINVKIEPGNEVVSVFTEHPELLYGVSFLQLASDHPLINRISASNELKPGLIKEAVMIHPLTGERIPIVVKDNGPLMSDVNRCRFGVSTLYAEDESTASLCNISLKPKVLTSQGLLQHSHALDGMNCEEARHSMCTHLQEKNVGGWPTSSELRDWLISRQRYWGTPIPIIHCASCGTVPVPEDDLPVVLPEVDGVDLKGGNPLKSQQDWINTSCPKCGGPAEREADTMDTFVDSAWYYLRFTDPHNSRKPFSKESARELMPVDVYVGGAEHAILHMYYARFFNHFLYDEGLTNSREPFSLQLALGTVHSDCYKLTNTGRYLPRGKVVRKGDEFVEKGSGEPVTHTLEKMSKSKLNGVSPADVLSVHGVDQTRLYMLANAAPRAVKNWDADLAKKLQFPHGRQLSIPRWMHVMWHTVAIIRERRLQKPASDLVAVQLDSEMADSLFQARNGSISSVSQHLSHTFNLHDAIHSVYDNMNIIDKDVPLAAKVQSYEFESCFADMLILLHPFAPHVTAELWEGLRTAPRLVTDRPSHDWASDIFNQRWPTVDDEYPVEFIVQHSTNISNQSEDDIDRVSQLEEPESETDQSAAHKEHCPTSQWTYLPAKVVSSLTTNQALQLALAHNLIASKDGVDLSSTGCKLVLRHNSGAILTVDDSVSIVRWRKRLTSAQDMTSSQEIAS